MCLAGPRTRRRASRFSTPLSPPGSTRSIRRTSTRVLDSGPQGRRIRDRARQLVCLAQEPRQGRSRHQGRHADGSRQAGPLQGLHRDGRDASLKRLQTDYIDLYFAHRDDEATPLEETLEAFAALVKEGKVRTIGASNYTAARLTDALSNQQARDCRVTKCCSPTTILPTARAMRRTRGGLPRSHDRRRALFRTGLRLPHREIPQRWPT